ncbi:hypothetical protein [Legionella spiritensis]|uniref:Type I secretion system LssZ n=1 Tax=Legionella spiritensis TaxID=452 RepID=A0A0W0YZ76_LEGSP|nr:hypothetical protein [Legionella spiritensis]KTD61814.1 type I secretion system LssZ [Legionella spiritensis]SNV38052.1 type I secretion system LssZ [Legionella spiritensis]
MYYYINYLQIIFPVLTVLLLVAGLFSRRKNLILAALWISLIVIIFQYQIANGEILGSYFNYGQATIYSINLAVLLTSLLYIILTLEADTISRSSRFIIGLFSATLVTGGFLLLFNIWFNAHFLADKKPDTPLLQVATFQKLDYCNYKYVFYKINNQGKIYYMCPNRYGLLPSQGLMEKAPLYVIKQLPSSGKRKAANTNNKS